MKICFFHLMPYRFLPDDFETHEAPDAAADAVASFLG